MIVSRYQILEWQQFFDIRCGMMKFFFYKYLEIRLSIRIEWPLFDMLEDRWELFIDLSQPRTNTLREWDFYLCSKCFFTCLTLTFPWKGNFNSAKDRWLGKPAADVEASCDLEPTTGVRCLNYRNPLSSKFRKSILGQVKPRQSWGKCMGIIIPYDRE